MQIYGVNKNIIAFKCSSKQGLNTRKNCLNSCRWSDQKQLNASEHLELEVLKGYWLVRNTRVSLPQKQLDGNKEETGRMTRITYRM